MFDSRNNFWIVDSRERTYSGWISPPFEIAAPRKSRERSNDSKHRYSGKAPLKLCPGGKELSVFKRFHPIVHGYTRAYARASRYTEPRLRLHAGTCARRREGGGGGHEGKRKARSSGRAVGQRERERDDLSLFPSSRLSLSLSLSLPVAVTGWEVAAC